MVEEECAVAEVLNLLEAQAGPAAGVLPAPGLEIPALCEQLAMLVSTGKSIEAVGAQLIHEQMKRFSGKDVEKYFKRYDPHQLLNNYRQILRNGLLFFYLHNIQSKIEHCLGNHITAFAKC